MKIHGKEYTEVKDRIPILLEQFPQAQIKTDIIWNRDDFTAVCMKATVTVGERIFTGLAYEERVDSAAKVNSSSWVENCETSAIGRALANMNIGVNGARPSAEEMQKVERMNEANRLKAVAKIDKILDAIKYAKAGAELDKIEKRVKELHDTGELTQDEFFTVTDKMKEKKDAK